MSKAKKDADPTIDADIDSAIKGTDAPPNSEISHKTTAMDSLSFELGLISAVAVVLALLGIVSWMRLIAVYLAILSVIVSETFINHHLMGSFWLLGAIGSILAWAAATTAAYLAGSSVVWIAKCLSSGGSTCGLQDAVYDIVALLLNLFVFMYTFRLATDGWELSVLARIYSKSADKGIQSGIGETCTTALELCAFAIVSVTVAVFGLITHYKLIPIYIGVGAALFSLVFAWKYVMKKAWIIGTIASLASWAAIIAGCFMLLSSSVNLASCFLSTTAECDSQFGALEIFSIFINGKCVLYTFKLAITGWSTVVAVRATESEIKLAARAR